MADDKPFWELYGVSSYEEFWEKFVIGDGTRSARKEATRLPEGAAPTLRQRKLRSCQVNVKLTLQDHGRLAASARRYGVAVSTMAQLLINRGLEAVEREG